MTDKRNRELAWQPTIDYDYDEPLINFPSGVTRVASGTEMRLCQEIERLQAEVQRLSVVTCTPYSAYVAEHEEVKRLQAELEKNVYESNAYLAQTEKVRQWEAEAHRLQAVVDRVEALPEQWINALDTAGFCGGAHRQHARAKCAEQLRAAIYGEGGRERNVRMEAEPDNNGAPDEQPVDGEGG